MDKQCLKLVTAKFEIDLHPSRLSDINAGVQEQLNTQLFKYSDEFDGVVMAIGDSKLLTKEAMIHPYFPFCRVEVSVPLLVFTPSPEDTVVGCVSKLGTDYIGMLVLGVLNASIPQEAIRKEFSYKGGEWRSSKNPSHIIRVGSYVKFKITGLQKQEAFFGISGSLLSKKSGCVEYLRAAKATAD